MEFNEIWKMLKDAHVLEIVYALGILIVGWVVALAISCTIGAAVRKTGVDGKLAAISDEKQTSGVRLDRVISRIVFWLIFLLALLGALSVLKLTETAAPIRNFIDSIGSYVPNLIGAGLLLLIGWVIASLFRIGALTVARSANVDARFPASEESKAAGKRPASEMISRAAYWLVLLFFVPAILRALKIDGITGPLEEMLTKVFDFLPNLFLGAAVLVIGFWAAGIVRKAISLSLEAVRLDELGTKLGFGKIFGEQKLSKLAGLVAYVLVTIPILITALSALKIDTLSRAMGGLLEKILGATGNVFGVVVLLFVAFVLGGIISGIVAQLLSGFGFDKLMGVLGFPEKEHRAKPSIVVGKLTLAAIMLFAAIASCETLGFLQLAEVLRSFTHFAGNVIVAVAVVLVGLWLANLAAEAVRARGETLALIVRVAVLVFTGAIALSHINLGGHIVELAFGLVLGAICVAAALAFGLGGRELAASKLKEWNDKIDKK